MVSSICLLLHRWNRRGGRDLVMSVCSTVEMLPQLGFGKSPVQIEKLLLLPLSRPLVDISRLREEASQLSFSSLEHVSSLVLRIVIVVLKPASLAFFASRPHHRLSR